ncbi:uncharacterized protein LOC100823830 [Brachypodium distachyon]|uniref:Uncharacterized protein n=1 Tax=Brachypodium distachyon TaxID=15368 RepID=I1GW55_BRADI|nr:uncharacterized protein LOC100823830 [Brachypodium distachyon]KQK17138.2 hypothetical protein BRADI_1g32645v3 [Brachypodium distachyon]|eukprot:XP_014751931.1 uncharacterized protein LOC100823830 [Brachypodium distachyon]
MNANIWCVSLVQTERSVDMLLHGKKPLVEVADIKRLMFYSHTLGKDRVSSCSRYFKIPPPYLYGGRQVLGVAGSLSFVPEVTSDQKVPGAAPWAVALLIAGSSPPVPHPISGTSSLCAFSLSEHSFCNLFICSSF